MIKTIGELKKAISNIDDDFTVDARIVRELSEEELRDSNYPYPYEYTKANLEIGDIGYSDKDVFINVEEISDDVCEWEKGSSGYVGYPAYYSKCCTTNSKGLEMQAHIIANWKYCPYCGKKIKVVE